MSDLCAYEIEDFVWDEFCQSEDHIVPHSTCEKATDHSFQGESRKKHCRELTGVPNKAREQPPDRSVCHKKANSALNDIRNKMLEKNSWSNARTGVFPSLCDSNSVKVVSSLASDGTRTSSHCFESNNTDLIESDYGTTDSILMDEDAAADNNSYNYPLGHIPQADNDIMFLDNDRNDKDSSDFLYYGWPDIGNFEDVDRMFRSCDSTFGLGASSEDELGWFLSSDAIEGSGNMLKAEFETPCPASSTIENNSENHDSMRTNEKCSSMNDSKIKNAFEISENNSWRKDDTDNLGQLSFSNGLNSSDNKDNIRPRKQGFELKSEVLQKTTATNCSANCSNGMTNSHKKQQKHQIKAETKRKSSYVGHGGSFYHDVYPPSKGKDMPSEATSCQTLSPGGIHQQKQDLGSDSFGYFQNNSPYLQSDYSHPSDNTSTFPIISSVRSDNHGYINISSNESSYSSNLVVSAKSSYGPAIQVTSSIPSEKMEKHHKEGLATLINNKPKNGDMGVQVPLCDHLSVEKRVQNSGKKLEYHANVEVVPGEFDSTVQESSSVSSGFDEVSQEATSFRQLQLVMEQLDLKTKLCIRDSLYRLARSAEQRHNHEHMKGSYCGDDRDANGEMLAEGTNKCTGLLDMETNTNPIDRSIAHLLFHRPSDTSVLPPQETVSFKSPTEIHGSVSSPPVMAEKSCSEEAMAAEMESDVADC